MKLKKDSWFLRSYLGYSDWERPYTVCQLGWKIVSMTALYLFIAAFGLTLLSPILVGIYALILGLFTSRTFAEISQHPLMGTCLFGTAAFVALLGILSLANWAYERRPKFEPGPVRQFTKGIWALVKDKTCVMIEYKD